MLKIIHRIKVQHLELGVILDEQFVDGTQFKLFLKMINGCFVDCSDLRFFNGVEFFLNVPFSVLKDCVITSRIEEMVGFSEIVKSKIEALETK
jgi:hypothetical protein